MSNTKITDLSYILRIPKIKDEGHLYFAEIKKHIPFAIKRFYMIMDVGNQAKRGFHAHKQTLQMLFCIKGSVKIILDNGKQREEILLNKPSQGIFLNKMMWHEMVDFKKGTILLVVASKIYDKKDYIRSYDQFLDLVGKTSSYSRSKQIFPESAIYLETKV